MDFDTVILPMQEMFISLYEEMIKLEGLFTEASAGGVVWKYKKKKQRKYPYYQFYDKRRQKGKRKVQKYIRKADVEAAFAWIEERRGHWKRLLEVRKEVKKLIKALKALGISAGELVKDLIMKKQVKGKKAVKNKFYEQWCRYLTANGEYVRSRAERKIANELYFRGISYVYEKRIKIQNRRFLPDFTLYVNGKTIYWEHLGMLDVKEYAEKWEEKQKYYKMAGIEIGVNLIVTTETQLNYLQIQKEMKNIGII